MDPPSDHAKADVFAAETSSVPHAKGLACAAEMSMALTPIDGIDCTIGFGRDS